MVAAATRQAQVNTILVQSFAGRRGSMQSLSCQEFVLLMEWCGNPPFLCRHLHLCS